MSFLKKGLLSKYITKNDASLNPRYVKTSDGEKKVWNYDTINDSDCCTIFFTKNTDIATFKFSLPPQSIEVTYPQRVFETKTFGGSVIEDYGNDTVQITIQGTTANSDIRSYVSGKTAIDRKSGTGIDELNSFQEILEKFGKVEDSGKKKVTLYYGKNSYYVYPKEFTVKQSKDNPLAHFYAISFLGTTEDFTATKVLEAFKVSFKEKINNLYQQFDDFVSDIEDSLSVLEEGLEVFEDFNDACETIKAATTRTEKAISNLTNQILAYPDAVSSNIREVTEVGDTVVSSGIRITLGTGEKAVNSAEELIKSVDEAIKFFEDFPDKYGTMSSDIIERMGMSSDEIVETCKYMFVSSKEKAEALNAELKQVSSSNDLAISPGDKKSDDEVVPTFGAVEYKVRQNDTWDSMSLKFYGDSSKAGLLCEYNNRMGDVK